MPSFRFGALDPRHRARLAEILAATGAFTTDEIAVALELFDETFEGEVGGPRSKVEAERLSEYRGPPTSDLRPPTSTYEFIGLFDEAGALAGYACFGATPGADGTYDLYWIVVHPAAQGAGGGARLLGEVERRLRERSGRLLVVETSSRPAYARTRRFYDGCGYREAARVADFYAPADDRVVYTKRLTPAGDAPAARSPSTN